MHMPPPVHGAAMMGQYIHDNQLLHEEFDCLYINPSASDEIKEIGKIKLRKILFLFKSLSLIIKTVRKEKPALCYLTPSSWDFGFYRDWLTVMVLKLLRQNIIVHFHNKGVKSFRDKWYNKLLYKIFFHNISSIFLAESLSLEFKEFIDIKRTYICPNGIAESLHKPIGRTSVHIPYTFLFLSNMLQEKGVYILLEACKLLKEQNYAFKCDFVGKWGEITESMFYERIEELQLNGYIEAHGAKYGEEKNYYFEKADCFVFPTYYHGETFGLVLLEGMEYSLPCISTLEGGIPDVVDDNQTGFLVPPKDPQCLYEKMKILIEHPCIGLEMGEKGRRKFEEQYTLDVFNQNIYNILKHNIR